MEKVKVEIIQTGFDSGPVIEVELGEEFQAGPNPVKVIREDGRLILVTGGKGRPVIGYYIREVS